MHQSNNIYHQVKNNLNILSSLTLRPKNRIDQIINNLDFSLAAGSNDKKVLILGTQDHLDKYIAENNKLDKITKNRDVIHCFSSDISI